MPIAIVDVGTNMAKLLVAEEQEGRLTVLADQERYIRLGEGLAASGEISPAAMERLRLALEAFRPIALRYGAKQMFASATSAAREAQNAEALVDFVMRRTGIPMEILSAAEEARWTFAGALAARPELTGSCAVVDIGGGSTEVALGRAGSTRPERWWSLPVGSVKLTEEHFSSLPPTAEQQKAAAAEARAVLRRLTYPEKRWPLLIGSTATVRLLIGLHGEGDALTAGAVGQWRERLTGCTEAEIRALDPEGLHGRADVFPAGILILDLLMQQLQAETCWPSPWELRHGLALRHFEGPL